MFLNSYYEFCNYFFSFNVTEPERIIFPLAISFFTFEFINYLVDTRNNKIATFKFNDFLAFVMFFPTMVAGPIKRFNDFVPKIYNSKSSIEDIYMGLTRILIGFGKKVIIADTMTQFIIPLQNKIVLQQSSAIELWIALFAYSIKIYFDFSGYSDIAIGSGRLFGIIIPENFNSPYLKSNIALFWRNWHISLTQWIIDYIYIPLGGSRKSFFRTIINTIIAMSISGLWHGAEWHFLLWGIYHGILLALYHIYKEKIKPKLNFLPKIHFIVTPVSVVFTFILVTIGWGLFVMPFDSFIILLRKLFTI